MQADLTSHGINRPTCAGLIDLAASGDTVAQRVLADAALRAEALRPVERLTAAEMWARLAAAGGGLGDSLAFADVLLIRARFELDRQSPNVAASYFEQARDVLEPLRSLGMDGAAERLRELPDREPSCVDETPAELYELLRASASGDRTATDRLAAHAVALFNAADCDRVIPLMEAEVFARLGASTGDPAQLRRLAGVLFKRAELEDGAGNVPRAHGAAAEALVILTDLIGAGENEHEDIFDALAGTSFRPAVASAAQQAPAVLARLTPEGSC